MKFDFTKEIILEEKYRKIYSILRGVLFTAAFLGFLYVGFAIFFPSLSLSFDFNNPNSLKNTIGMPQNSARLPLENGREEKNKIVYFDAGLSGAYSKVKVSFTLDKKSQEPGAAQLKVRRSYQSFLLPEGDPMGLNADFGKTPGFADGTPISYGGSVYIVSGKQIFPINNPITFEAMGYNWNDVIPASGDEIALYSKARLLTISSPHPEGTIFSTTEDGTYYLIKNGQKHLLPSADIASSWNSSSPILVSQEGLDISARCGFKKKLLSWRTYSCEMPIGGLKDLIGKDYEFEQTAGNDIKISNINIVFEKEVSFASFRSTLAEIVNRVINRYVPQEVPIQ